MSIYLTAVEVLILLFYLLLRQRVARVAPKKYLLEIHNDQVNCIPLPLLHLAYSLLLPAPKNKQPRQNNQA